MVIDQSAKQLIVGHTQGCSPKKEVGRRLKQDLDVSYIEY